MKNMTPQQPESKEENSTGKVSRLLNSIYYFLDCVFIISWEGEYRLIILHHDEVVMDSYYKTLRGAKIAFAKFFGEHGWAMDLQPQWSYEYPADNDWLKDKFDILKKGKRRKIADINV